MPNFHKEETELETRLDKWLYFIKHLEDFQTIPHSIADEVFKQAFEKAELANLGAVEMVNYEKSLKIFRDLNGAFDTAFGDGKLEGKIEGKLEGKIEGKLEGKMEGKLEIAKALKNMGVLTATIIASTGLTKEEIEKL
jgi:predicted transposase/invertase (TIGR01784 family)